MSWFRIEGRMPNHRKVAPLSDAAFRLHITAGCWSVEERTEGKIPFDVPATLPRAQRGSKLENTISDLIARGLWERTEHGYVIHDFLNYNLSNDDAAAKSAAGRLGGKKSGASRRSKREAGASIPPLTNEADASLLLKQTRSKTQAEPETESEPPTEVEATSPPIRSLDASTPFKLYPTWDPGSVVLMGSSVPPWAHRPILESFRTHHCNGIIERTETGWRQSYAKWATKDWNDPARKPVKPDEPEVAPQPVESKAERQARLRAKYDRAGGASA